jgi:hypothetical protein
LTARGRLEPALAPPPASRTEATAPCAASVDVSGILPVDLFGKAVSSIEGKSAAGLETFVPLPDLVPLFEGVVETRGAGKDVGVTTAGTRSTGAGGAAGAPFGAGGASDGTPLGGNGGGDAVTDSTAPAASSRRLAEAKETPQIDAIRKTAATAIPQRKERVDVSVESRVDSKVIAASRTRNSKLAITQYLDVYTRLFSFLNAAMGSAEPKPERITCI